MLRDELALRHLLGHGLDHGDRARDHLRLLDHHRLRGAGRAGRGEPLLLVDRGGRPRRRLHVLGLRGGGLHGGLLLAILRRHSLHGLRRAGLVGAGLVLVLRLGRRHGHSGASGAGTVELAVAPLSKRRDRRAGLAVAMEPL